MHRLEMIQCSMSPDGANKALLGRILGVLESKQPDFPRIDLSSSLPPRSLNSLQACAPVQTLIALLREARLEPLVGLSMGFLAVRFPIPKLSRSAVVGWSDMGLVVGSMFHMLPMQEDLERCHELTFEPDSVENSVDVKQSEQDSIVTFDILQAHLRKRQEQDLLANKCLREFSKHTGIGVLDLQVDFSTNNMIVKFDSTVNLRVRVSDGVALSDSELELFRYDAFHPSAFDARTGSFTKDALCAQRRSLCEQIVSDFWKAVDKRLYLANVDLKEMVTRKLHDSFRDLLAGSSRSAMYLYLHGRAGVGKSAFVKVFREALQHVVRSRLDPFRSVEVVRIPLNATTPTDLYNVIYVKGLSDWSIERIVEQTLCKKGFVILHLEENPADVRLQGELFKLINTLLNKTFDRYPTMRGQVVVIFTSNYEPAEEIAALVGREQGVMELKAPAKSVRIQWCERSVSAILLHSVQQLPPLSLELADAVPADIDMRELNAWKQSVGYFLSRYVAQFGAKLSEHYESIQVCVRPVDGRQRRLNCTFTADALRTPCMEPLELFSSDGILMCPVSYRERVLANDATPPHVQMQLLALCEMVQREFIKPGVVVVQGRDAASRASEVQRVYDSLRWMCGAETKVTSLHLEARTDADKAKITGDPDPTYGVLPRYIDTINGPTSNKHTLGVVFVECNVLGQFVLREYLESDVSRTHVTAVRKERVLFVLNLDDGQPLSAQVRSRARIIIDL